MPLTSAPPRELLSVEYTSAPTFTSTATDGQAVSPAWGGTFIVASNGTVEISIDVPYIYTDASNFVSAHLIVDGTSLGKRTFYCYVGSVGAPVHGVFRISGLSAGSHTVAVQCAVGSGTGTLLCASTQKGILSVREVG